MLTPQSQNLLLPVLHHADRTGIVVLSPEGVSYPHISFFLVGRDLVEISVFHHKLQERLVILKLLLLIHVVVRLVLVVDHQWFLKCLVCEFFTILVPQSEKVKYGGYERKGEEESEDEEDDECFGLEVYLILFVGDFVIFALGLGPACCLGIVTALPRWFVRVLWTQIAAKLFVNRLRAQVFYFLG